MIAAAIFSFAGIYAALMPVPRDATGAAILLSLGCWAVAGLCAAGVLA